MVGLFMVYRETILVFSKEEIRRTATLPTDFFFIFYYFYGQSRTPVPTKKGEILGLVFYVKHSIIVFLNRMMTMDFKQIPYGQVSSVSHEKRGFSVWISMQSIQYFFASIERSQRI